ncbi:lipoate--protein ligase [Marinifilum caeruleilacunae]|uniref:lipoate--protein ligase n=1 Tax=Marinifilum caeruleilacunae TaxID=2499076 RepID=A0ABX1WUY0_9BACT|nr:lipoate--protein ligase [Marinifilum caeruleilacunae]NOU59826.1 lipoate--protein ligase [Marinifilum caeruleilacunae]
MNYFISNSNDPYFNLACEEYLLKNYDEDFFFLYINQDSLVVGKHQNTLAEINLDRVNAENIPVVRRLSGGGTVYHDFGNLNYCLIKKGEKGKLVDFKAYSQPIINALQKLNVNAKFEGKSDLTIDGKKFSGNASHVYKNKVMQHGTMLFSSDLKRLNQLLKVNPLKFKDRGVRSIRSRVTNITDYLSSSITISNFAELVIKEFENTYPNSKPFTFSQEDINAIEKIRSEKFLTWEWNYGYSPNYNFEKLCTYPSGKILEIEMRVEKGLITELDITGNCIKNDQFEDFLNTIKGTNHINTLIYNNINSINLDLYFNNISSKELYQLFF